MSAIPQEALSSGIIHLGEIAEPFEVDEWELEAEAGDYIIIRLGETDNGSGFHPHLQLFAPDATLLADDEGPADGWVSTVAATPGTYSLQVADYNTGASDDSDDTGSYRLEMIRLPGAVQISEGDDGGPLSNGALHNGSIHVGDIDAWTFEAEVGDFVNVRLGETDNGSGFDPHIELVDPSGTVIAEDEAPADGWVSLTATVAGTYTVLVTDHADGASDNSDDTGSYRLEMIRLPGEFLVSEGDDGGPLTSGLLHEGTIHVGDIDTWTVEAEVGDVVTVRLGETDDGTGFAPHLRLLGPDGTLLSEEQAPADGWVETVATVAGLHFVQVLDQGRLAGEHNDDSGSYRLEMIRLPGEFLVSEGDEGGPLTNGTVHEGAIHVGDIDTWTFEAEAGDVINLEMAKIPDGTDLRPYMRLFAPDGSLVAANDHRSSVVFNVVIQSPGIHTVQVADDDRGASDDHDDVGGYLLRLIKYPPDLLVPETQMVNELDLLSVELLSWDPIDPEKELTFEVVSAPGGVSLTTQGATSALVEWTPTEEQGAGTHTIVARVIDVVEGTAWIRTNSFDVVVHEVNVAPELTLPADATIPEMEAWTGTAVGTDADIPENTLTYALLSGPDGMTIDSGTGALLWTPTEQQGPGSFEVMVQVTDSNPDAVNENQLSAEGGFTLTVVEANRPPTLAAIEPQSIPETSPFELAMTGDDPDIPANGLTFSLVGPPDGASIDPATGLISWTPPEDLGGQALDLVVKVTDDGLAPAGLSTTTTVAFTIEDTNTAPELDLPTQPVSFLELGNSSHLVTAADSDLPTDTLTFELVGGPEGLSVSATSGLLSWTPGETTGGQTFTATVRVSDNGDPEMSAEGSITIFVAESNSAPTLVPPNDQSVDEGSPLSMTLAATDPDDPANTLTYSLLSGPEGTEINPSSGTISWTPTESQGPDEHVFTVKVTDDGEGMLGDEATFSVTVNEINSAPVVEAVTDRTTIELSKIEIPIVANDADLPANTLAYALTSSPEGASIDATTGVISWTPTETQGPGSGMFTVKVEDNGVPTMSTEVSFNIEVNEANSAPVIREIADLSHRFGELLELSTTIVDTDVPLNVLTHSLDVAPVGMNIDPVTGLITWTPGEDQVGRTVLVTIRTIDDDTVSPLGDTESFRIFVTGNEPTLAISTDGSGRASIEFDGMIGATYELLVSADLKQWEPLFEIVLQTSPFNYVDEESSPEGARFYRLRSVE